MLTERSIINFLIWGVGLILGPYLAMAALSGNWTPLLIGAAICFLVFIFGVGRDKMCVLPLLGLSIAGRFNFLPLRLAPGDVCALALVLYYVVTYIALQRKRILTGPMFFFLPILVVGAIVFYHDHSFGLRSMGGGREGARGALFVLLACITYLCGVSVNGLSPVFLTRIPFYCVIAAVLSGIPFTLTTYVPALAPYLILFTDNINGLAVANSVLGSDEIVRNAGQAYLGQALMAYLMAFYPINTWWRPHRWWVVILALVSCESAVMGGYRSEFIVFAVMCLAAAWCHCSWRSLMLAPPLLLAVFLATAVQNSHVVKLPNSAQRTLAFLPGDWDPEVVSSTESSNDFRQKIQKVYLDEEVGKSPLVGNGFSYDSAEFQKMNYMAQTQDTAEGYYETKIFVTGKMFHTGWISVYDAVGLIGTAAFVFLPLSLLWVLGRRIFPDGTDHKSPFFPVNVWMFCNVFASLFGFFAVFGDFKTAFPGFCYMAIIWVHMDRVERLGYTVTTPLRSLPSDQVRAGTPVLA